MKIREMVFSLVDSVKEYDELFSPLGYSAGLGLVFYLTSGSVFVAKWAFFLTLYFAFTLSIFAAIWFLIKEKRFSWPHFFVPIGYIGFLIPYLYNNFDAYRAKSLALTIPAFSFVLAIAIVSLAKINKNK